MKCVATEIPEVLLVTPTVHGDDRGFFLETYVEQRYVDAGMPGGFVQDNYSHSSGPVLRGLHYQLNHPQSKLVSVTRGEIFDVAVDIRAGSPTFGRWVGQCLSDENRAQLFIPAGFAHGFCLLSERADVMYKCTDYYHPDDDRGIHWSDPDIGIEWPIEDPQVSERDTQHPRLADVAAENLPRFSAG